jgi:hypothetical protein
MVPRQRQVAVEVLGGAAQALDVVGKLAQPTVAVEAEDPANLAGGVVMIHVRLVTKVPLTDRARPTLVLDHGPDLVNVETVGPGEMTLTAALVVVLLAVTVVAIATCAVA